MNDGAMLKPNKIENENLALMISGLRTVPRLAEDKGVSK